MRPRILIVEDEADYRSLLRPMLEREGCAVEEAANAAEALAAVERGTFDLALLDVNLPDGDGFSLCRAIRERHGDRVAVLFCTIRSELSRVSEGLRLGADDYILKPFEPGEVVERVRRALAARGP